MALFHITLYDESVNVSRLTTKTFPEYVPTRSHLELKARGRKHRLILEKKYINYTINTSFV
jgi:hypothetical protein